MNQKDYEIIKSIIKGTNCLIGTWKKSKVENIIKAKNHLIEITNFLDENEELKVRLYCFLNDIISYPKCKYENCQNLSKIYSHSKFNDFCNEHTYSEGRHKKKHSNETIEKMKLADHSNEKNGMWGKSQSKLNKQINSEIHKGKQTKEHIQKRFGDKLIDYSDYIKCNLCNEYLESIRGFHYHLIFTHKFDQNEIEKYLEKDNIIYFDFFDKIKDFSYNNHVIKIPIYNEEYNNNIFKNGYIDWLNNFWYKTIKNSLKESVKYFCFVINDKYKYDMKNICLKNEFKLQFIKEIKLGDNRKNHLNKKENMEYLCIFKKLD
jgi:hypothetical protein